MKELRSNIIEILPSLFSHVRAVNSGNRSNNGSASQNQSTNRIMKELDSFRTKFEFLCNSPRLSKPAWLTIVQNKKVENDVHKKQQVLSTCTKLISDFLYLYENLNNSKNNLLVIFLTLVWIFNLLIFLFFC